MWSDGILPSCLASFFIRPRAEPFFHPGPRARGAVARSGGQGRPHLGAARARFIIADLTDPSSIPHELATIIPMTPVPVQPILLSGSSEFAMFRDFGCDTLGF